MGRRRDRWQGSSRRMKIDLTDSEPQANGVDFDAGEDKSRNTGENDAATATADSSPPSQSGARENSLSLLDVYNADDDGKVEQEAIGNVDEKKIDAEVADFIAELETSGLLDSNASEDLQPEEKNNPEQPASISQSKEVTERTSPPSLASMIGDVVQKVLAENEKEPEASDWKAVANESGEYYYWNVVTGETTWIKPDAPLEAAVSAPPLPLDGYAGAQPTYGPIPENVIYHGLIGTTDDTDARLGSAALMQLGETICERLNVLCGDALVTLPNRVRLAIEAEIRLADCRLLLSQGLTDSLMWTNTEAHIRRLESSLASEQEAVKSDHQNLMEPEDVDMEVDMDIEETETLQEAGPPPEESTARLAPLPPIQAPVSDLEANEDIPETTSISTSSAGLAEAAAVAAKKANKAARVKKGTVPVRTASKMSSLVNKWMAANEELHETDEEEDAKELYDAEAIERKRQREIDDWRREQIASGQALDNVNFQPLGPVDWRQRVKRARKEDKSNLARKEDTAKLSASKKSGAPNLDLLSKGLAPGWKAYYDEKSGDVYYGNLGTSETTWDRPEA